MKVIGTTCLTLLLAVLSGCAISASPDDQGTSEESASERAGDLEHGAVGTTGQAYETQPNNLPTYANTMRSGSPSQPSSTSVTAVSGGESHEPHPNPWRLNSDPSNPSGEQPSNPDRRSQSL